MNSYFVAKSRQSGFIGELTFEEIARRHAAGDIPGDYVAATAIDGSFNQLVKSGNATWTRVSELVAQAPASRAEVFATSGHEQSSSVVVNRYRDGYRVGAALEGLGTTIKVVGAVLGGTIVIGSLSAGSGPLGVGAVVAGIFIAAIVGALFWVSGVVVAAQGQILRATLDNAVASSHFLTDTERAGAMALPHSVVVRSGA